VAAPQQPSAGPQIRQNRVFSQAPTGQLSAKGDTGENQGEGEEESTCVSAEKQVQY